MDWTTNETDPTVGAETRYVDVTAVVSAEGAEFVARCLEVPVAVYGTTIPAASQSLERAVQAVLERSAQLGELDRFLAEHRLTAPAAPVQLTLGKYYTRIEIPVAVPALAVV